jgi:putative peptide zinc metalloprotease protein
MCTTTPAASVAPHPLTLPQPLERADRLPSLSPSTQLREAFQGGAFEDRPYLFRRGAAYLLNIKLRPLGVLGDVQSAPTSKPLLSLRLRVRVVPETLHRRVTTALSPLFSPPVVVGFLAALVFGDLAVFLAGAGSAVGGGGQVISDPTLRLILLVLTLATAAFPRSRPRHHHPLHGQTGVMEAGIYLIWPVFYTDVADACRLDRRGRLRTTSAGVYFNVVMLAAADTAYLATRFGPLLVFIVVTHLEVLYQFLPFVRLDGYWVLSDLIGVPNLADLGPVTARLDDNGRRKLNPLRPRARRAITPWVVLTIAILATNAVLIIPIGLSIFRLTWQPGHARISQHLLDISQGRSPRPADPPPQGVSDHPARRTGQHPAPSIHRPPTKRPNTGYSPPPHRLQAPAHPHRNIKWLR